MVGKVDKCWKPLAELFEKRGGAILKAHSGRIGDTVQIGFHWQEKPSIPVGPMLITALRWAIKHRRDRGYDRLRRTWELKMYTNGDGMVGQLTTTFEPLKKWSFMKLKEARLDIAEITKAVGEQLTTNHSNTQWPPEPAEEQPPTGA